MNGLTGLVLDTGRHDHPSEGLCLLEAVAYVAGEAHSDDPTCVSPVLGAFGRQLNDVLPYDLRQQLIPLIPRLVGTAGDGLDERRGFMALDWLTRVYLPAFLELAPRLVPHADGLRSHPEVMDAAGAESIARLVRAARFAAGVAARDAADPTTRFAAGAARAAAHVAMAATDTAAWDADTAAWDAAAAVWSAARAVWAAVWDAALDAAARDALAGAADALQVSMIDLFERMIHPVEGTR